MNGQNIAHAVSVAAVSDPVNRLASLFDIHYDRLYRLARRLTSSADDALDLVQETFLRAARSPKSIPAGAANEEAWLVRVLINIRRDQWRKMRVRDRHQNAEVASERSSGDSRDALSGLIARDAVWRALEGLPPRRRAAIVMHELDGMAIPEIASLLGISGITVRWHLSMGRRQLTQTLKARVDKTSVGGAK